MNTMVWVKRMAYIATIITIVTVGGLLITAGWELVKVANELMKQVI